MSDEQVVDQVQVDVPEVDQGKLDNEKEARSQGWVPKEEFRGKETDWIEAEVFVQRGREINPILRKSNERLQKELDKHKQDLADLRIGVEEFKKFQKDLTEKKIASFETEIASLREQKKLAISSGDGELAVQLDDQMDAVKEARATAKEEAKVVVKEEVKAPVTNPKIEAWVEDNAWYKNSPAMAAQANELAEGIRNGNPFFNEEQFLVALDKALEETYTPEKLGRKTKAKNPMDSGTSTSTSSGSSKGKNSYESLPPEAKDACDMFVKQGLYKTKQDYVNEYYA